MSYESHLQEREERKLVDGDAYRLMIEHAYKKAGKKPGSLVYEGKRLVVPSFYLMGCLFSAIGAVGNLLNKYPVLEENEMYEKGRYLRDASKGIRYTRKVFEIGGEELVNFALVYDHGPKLVSPRSLLNAFSK